MRKMILLALTLTALASSPPAFAAPPPDVGVALGSVTAPPATGVLVDQLVVPAPDRLDIASSRELSPERVLTAGLSVPVLAAASAVLSGFVSMAESAALQEAANPVVWGAVLVLIVLLIAKKKKAYADAITEAAQKAYNATETLKLTGKLGAYEDKARRALVFFNAEMEKKNLTVTDAAIDAAKEIWADLHNEAVATGTHQDAPSSAPKAA